MRSLLFFTLLLAGCASIQADTVPVLSNRTLRISDSIPGFTYQYKVCVKKLIGFCTKHEMHIDVYDLRDPVVRKQLIDMGFVARVKEQIK